MKIQRLLVEKDGIYYQCQAKTDFEYKCGHCLFGIIPAIIKPSIYPVICKRCGAKHHSTTYSTKYNYNYLNTEIFYS